MRRTTEWVFVLALVLLHLLDVLGDTVASSAAAASTGAGAAAAAAAAAAATVGTGARRQPHVLFVSLPWRGHVNALRSVARLLVERGFSVAFALPNECQHWLGDDEYEFVPTGPAHRITRAFEQPWLHALRTNASSLSPYASASSPSSASAAASGYSNTHLHAASDADDSGAAIDSAAAAAAAASSASSAAAAAAAALLQQQQQPLNANTLAHNAAVAALAKTLVQYQRQMIHGLTARLRARKPALMVVDRFTLAGFDVAHAFNVSYVVNSPHLLLDIDDPPSYYPAPYSYSTGVPHTLWERLWNGLQRLSVRIGMLRHALFELNTERAHCNAGLQQHAAQAAAQAAAAALGAGNTAAAAPMATPLPKPTLTTTAADAAGSPSDAPPAMADPDIGAGDSDGDADSPADAQQQQPLGPLSTQTDGTGKGSGAAAAAAAGAAYSRALIPMLSSLRDLHAGHIVLSNTVFGFEYARPLLPRFRMVGPLLPATPEPLQPKLHAWLDDAAAHGEDVFFVNTGDDALLDSAQMNNLLTGLLLKKNVRLLWVLSPANRARLLPESLPSVVRVTSYVSQLSVLAHPAVRLSVTHATLTAAQEALYHAKPVLLIPFYADQFEVAVRALHAGCGLMLQPSDTHSVRAVSLAVHQLLSNRTFSAGAARMSHVLRASGGAREAATLIELVAKVGPGFALTPADALDAATATDSYTYTADWIGGRHGAAGSRMAWSRAAGTVSAYLQLWWWDVYAVYVTVLGLMALGVRQCWSTLNALLAPLPLNQLQPLQPLPSALGPHR